jgi:hypothetical protein
MKKVNSTTLSGDRWDGDYNFEWRDEGASRNEFEYALGRLDAKTYTLLTIHAEGDAHLTIAGGNGQYVVYATFDNEDFWNLIRSEDAGGTVILNAGGQEGDYPARQVVGMPEAHVAGLFFLDFNHLDSSHNWEKQQ